ncbi:protein ALTERED PHOSPHATE STARVATION RESPONSE 1 [Ricinus communis]|uniref:protein ALTERED PHOSPHATE STARVATION RESPONSE 1 n=1 Tax=Ricinus communis TaxID=3988 RepID=UPI00201B1399|nr:protein ALTERED PHOSPHATE STARVATION RESPONSE 1 [Ricinus communis]
MGCSTSRIDHLPVVSLCHDRCKFLEEALYQSYALADAHVAYVHSLKTLGPSLSRFFEVDQNLDNDNKDNDNNHSDSQSKPLISKSSPSPDHCPSTSNSDSHLDFPSDDSEDEEFKEKDFDLLHRIQHNYFDRQTPTPSRTNSYSYRDHYNKYDCYANNGTYGVTSPDGGSAWKTPSPPPPPSGSTWEFLNLFDPYERYELLIKDKEGIHEVKEEFENETHGDDKFGGDSVHLAKEEKQIKVDVKKNEVHVEKTKVVSEKEEKEEKKNLTESKNQSPLMVIRELEGLFDRAAESGIEVLKILDTGKFRYYHKNSIYQGVSSKMLHAVTPSFLVIPPKSTDSLTSSTEKIGSVHVSSDEEFGVIAVNLSSTLKKLCMWEKKLYDEVKAEEKLRIMLSRSYRQMKDMGEKGAESNKVRSDRALIRALSTKIKVAIHVIDRTTVTINKLRDEELWPMISQLSQKLLGMWKAMLDCHRCQSQTIVGAKSLDAIVSNGKFSETHVEAAIQLKIELQNWNLSFSDWITAQRGYVKALSGWLLKCLPYEPEEMPDETPPSSPGSKSGQPPLFAFCNQWSHAAGRISEMEVTNAMHGFFVNINQLVERHYTYLQQRLAADKDLEKRMKVLERKEKKIQKVLQSRGKKMLLPTKDLKGTQFSGGAVHQSEVTYNSSLHLGLKQIFTAIEKFSADNVQIYEELHVYIDESNPTRGNKQGL